MSMMIGWNHSWSWRSSRDFILPNAACIFPMPFPVACIDALTKIVSFRSEARSSFLTSLVLSHVRTWIPWDWWMCPKTCNFGRALWITFSRKEQPTLINLVPHSISSSILSGGVCVRLSTWSKFKSNKCADLNYTISTSWSICSYLAAVASCLE